MEIVIADSAKTTDEFIENVKKHFTSRITDSSRIEIGYMYCDTETNKIILRRKISSVDKFLKLIRTDRDKNTSSTFAMCKIYTHNGVMRYPLDINEIRNSNPDEITSDCVSCDNGIMISGCPKKETIDMITSQVIIDNLGDSGILSMVNGVINKHEIVIINNKNYYVLGEDWTVIDDDVMVNYTMAVQSNAQKYNNYGIYQCPVCSMSMDTKAITVEKIDKKIIICGKCLTIYDEDNTCLHDLFNPEFNIIDVIKTVMERVHEKSTILDDMSLWTGDIDNDDKDGIATKQSSQSGKHHISSTNKRHTKNRRNKANAAW